MCSGSACRCEGVRQDLLARVVGLQRTALQLSQDRARRLLFAAPLLRRAVCSPQAVHVLAAGAVGVVCTVVYNGSELSPHRPSPLLAILYILSSSLHIGAQFWMTFVSGLTLYFSLSRHAFGDVQQVLFPRYFTLNSFFSSLTFIAFVKLHQHIPSWTFRHYLQGSCLAVGFLVESLARLYLAPQVLDAMARVRAMEVAVEGVGKEVGRHHPGQLAQSPEYNATYSQFRRYHSLMAIANVLSISCSIAHLFHLASALHFS